MDRSIRRKSIGLFVALVLLVCGGGAEAQAQLRESARPPESDAVQPASQLDPYRSLETYVQRTDTLALRFTSLPPLSPSSPRLSQGQRLLWGSVGLFVNAACESQRDPYDTRRSHCDRVGDRAAEALFRGMFGL